MNSLEALEKLDFITNVSNSYFEDYEKYKEQIETSLKALEIIKEYCNISLYEDDIKGWGHIYILVIENKKTGTELKLHINKEQFDLFKKELEK